MAEDSANVVQDINLQIQHALSGINPDQFTPRHNTISPLEVKDKEKVLKGAREKQHVT